VNVKGKKPIAHHFTNARTVPMLFQKNVEDAEEKGAKVVYPGLPSKVIK